MSSSTSVRLAIGRAQDDPADRLTGLGEQLDWLRAAGLEDVDCQFKWLQLALCVGTRCKRAGGEIR